MANGQAPNDVTVTPGNDGDVFIKKGGQVLLLDEAEAHAVSDELEGIVR